MPFKVFAVNEILTAADVNDYLAEQAVATFAGTAARAASLGTPVEGQVTYLADTDSFEYWDSSAWVKVVPDATPTSAGVVKGTTSDGSNTALGDGAFTSNTTGGANTGVGRRAMAANTTGGNNTALGYEALEKNTTGIRNVAVGENALGENVDGGTNVAVGRLALFQNVSGDDNTAVGQNALQNNTVSGNTAVGHLALNANTTGTENVALGVQALDSTTTAIRNTAVGHDAMGDTTTGQDNAAVGQDALHQNIDGSQNTAIGRFAGYNGTSTENCTLLGFNAQPSSATVSSEITLGDTNITSLRCNVTTISSLSDIRDKTDVEDTTLGVEVINKLRPVEFTWARRDGSLKDTPDIGFIAQDLAALEDELGETERLRLTLRENPEKLEATPGRLIPILVKAVQELSDQNAELHARVEALEAK